MWRRVYISYSITVINGGIEDLGSIQDLYLEVHTIAYFYHWTEEVILKLTTEKRKMYFKLIQEQVKAESGTDEDEDDYD